MALIRKVGLEDTLTAFLGSLVLLAIGCAENSSTGPGGTTEAPPREPSLVIRESNVGCVPEVVTESTEEFETVLVTFNVPPGSSDNCWPKLAKWGIDMADPVGVDTPQGSSRFIVEGQEIVAINMPSPPYAVRNGFYTPAQVAVEFDPPIRKAEFHYSRLKNDRAHWGLQGNGVCGFNARLGDVA